MTQVISWRTHKISDGSYAFVVFSFGYQIPETTLKTGVCRTREIATHKAQKWTRWFKTQARKAA